MMTNEDNSIAVVGCKPSRLSLPGFDPAIHDVDPRVNP